MLQKFSDHLNETIIRMETLRDGVISEGHVLHGESNKYFVRKVKQTAGGFEYPGDHQRSFSISHLMYTNAQPHITSHGIVHIGDDVYHVQDYIDAQTIDKSDLTPELVQKIAYAIAQVHMSNKEKISEFSDQEKRMLYARGRREVVTNHETTLSIFEQYIVGQPDAWMFKDIVYKMMDEYFELVQADNVYTRLAPLHGDFWEANMLLVGQNIELIDFSRIPYGDPAIDIGTFYGVLQIFSYLPEYKHFSDLADLFLSKYIDKTKDQNIIQYMRLGILWAAYINLSPLAQKFLNWSADTKLDVMNYIQSI